MKRLILGLLVCLALATAMTADTRFEEERDDAPSETCGEIDAANPCYISVGSYIGCAAKGSANQMCTKMFILDGVAWCTWVQTSANCQCDAVRKRADGLCTYYK
jgi:hypothetical protein